MNEDWIKKLHLLAGVPLYNREILSKLKKPDYSGFSQLNSETTKAIYLVITIRLTVFVFSLRSVTI
jgi:hypothetical protein